MKNNKGFTLIELMIVIAIIAIIAAIAIPNLMASRVRANEAAAISAIKQIATAQVTYQAGRQGRSVPSTGGQSGFSDNYRNLDYGTPVGEGAASTVKLALVSDAVANAAFDLGDGGGSTASITGKAGYLAAGTGTAGAGSGDPYQGFLFSSDSNAVYTADYACYGMPVLPGSTGNNVYWVGQQGTVYAMGLPNTFTTAEFGADTTPQTDTGLKVTTNGGWFTM